MNAATKELKLAVIKLLEAKKFRTIGWSRGTRYNAKQRQPSSPRHDGRASTPERGRSEFCAHGGRILRQNRR